MVTLHFLLSQDTRRHNPPRSRWSFTCSPSRLAATQLPSTTGSTHPADESLPPARTASQSHGLPKYSFSSFSLETAFSFIYCACKKSQESCVRTGTPKGRRSSCRLALRCLSTDDPGTVAFNSQGELREISLQLGFPVHGVDVISAVGNGPKHCQRRGECPIRPWS
jgi:hypothetical protein